MALLHQQQEDGDLEYWIENDGLITLEDLVKLLALNNKHVVRRRRTDRRASTIAFNFSSKQICAALEESLAHGTACKVINRACRRVVRAIATDKTSVDMPDLTKEEIDLLRAAATISGMQTRSLCKTITTTKPCSAFRPDGNQTLCGCEFISRSARRSTEEYYKARSQESEAMRCIKPEDCSIIVLTELIVDGLQMTLVSTPRSVSTPMQFGRSKTN